MSQPAPRTDAVPPPDARASAAHRQWEALARLKDRHAATDFHRQRQAHPTALEPHEAARLVLGMASGTIEKELDEPPLDEADIAAALTLIAQVRADVDALENGLLHAARARGMSWQDISASMGLDDARAAERRLSDPHRLLA